MNTLLKTKKYSLFNGNSYNINKLYNFAIKLYSITSNNYLDVTFTIEDIKDLRGKGLSFMDVYSIIINNTLHLYLDKFSKDKAIYYFNGISFSYREAIDYYRVKSPDITEKVVLQRIKSNPHWIKLNYLGV